MRAWIFGGLLVAAAAGGVYVAVVGAGSPSHCGPCLKGLINGGVLDDSLIETERDSVTEVVDLTAALAPPKQEPNGLPFLSFDEPPLAKPVRPLPEAVVQTSFVAPIPEVGPVMVEVAPPPRSRPTGGPIPRYDPSDPF